MTPAEKPDSSALEADDVAIAERYTVWSERKRRVVSFMLGYLCLASSLTSTIYFPFRRAASASLTTFRPTTSTWPWSSTSLLQGILPAIWSPLSDTWGAGGPST